MTKHKDAKEFIQKAKAAAQQLEDKTDDHIKEQINDLLDDFGRLFGDRLPVFIPCQLKTKKPIVKYGHLTETPEELRIAVAVGGNIAVKVGEVSYNLVAIDFDDDDVFEEFILLNNTLAGTLLTRANRGCQLWFYATDDYPHEVRHISISGKEKTGEWRGGKGGRG